MNPKHEAMLEAIDFFTQKFNIDQLSDYSFEFTNNILCLDESALFIKEGTSFLLKKSKNFSSPCDVIEDTPKLQRIATLYGNVMTSSFDSYFENKDIEMMKPTLIIPLIIKDLLYGFVVSRSETVSRLSKEDLAVSKALMQLINNSLESSQNFLELQHTNRQLDQKIFNLYSINQSSRMLLSELDLTKLYSLAIDIFSELTSSRVTSFGLYDEIKNRIVLRGYRDVFSADKHQLDFELKQSSYSGYKMVFHYEQDKKLLQEIFVNCEDFKQLAAEYIILIVKEKVLGFVTISKPVNDRAYDQALFELIESLAASTYISFKNAIFFTEIHRQKQSIQQKLHIMTNLNSLIRNINSCTTVEELCDISIKTLHYSFGIKKAFIALLDGNRYIIKNHAGFQLKQEWFDLNHKWENIHGNTYACYLGNEVEEYFPAQLALDVGISNCLIISPLVYNNIDLDDEALPLGYIVVLHTSQSLKEEEVLLVETLSNSIAPTIGHLQEIMQIKKEFVPNQRQLFLQSLGSKLSNRDKYHIDFYLYYKKQVQIPFENPDFSMYNQYEHYYFDNMLLVFCYDPQPLEEFDGSLEVSNVEEAVHKLRDAYIPDI